MVKRSGRLARERTAKTTHAVLFRVLLASIVTLGIAGYVVPTFALADSPAPAAPVHANVVAGTPQKWFGIASTRGGGGYWVVSNGGAVDSFGNAMSYGDMSKTILNQSMVGMAPTADGKGYWLDAGDGGIFSFGDAGFFGSTGSIHLNQPVVGMAPTHDGHGYWMVASDGGIFAFGDAPFEGSLGASPPSSPIVYMAPTPDNNGYWLLSQNGTVYAFGDARNYGSVTGSSAPATSLAATPSEGYWVLTSDGAVHPFGDASNFGSPATGPVATLAPASVPATPAASSAGGSSGAYGGSSSSGTNPVSVTAISPSSGTAGGGDTIHISGSGFTGATAINFGSNASSDFTVTSATSVTAVAPVGAGTVNVQVVTPSGTSSASSSARFTYVSTGQLPITASGQHLEIGGVPTLFTGFNAYQLATDWGTNAGCGGMATTAQIDSFFSSLRPNSLVRFWAWQGTMATNVHTGQLDWAPLDNVFYQAAKYHVYLIPVIAGQSGSCDDGHWRDPAWYSGGFKNVYDSTIDSDGHGLTPLSYWDYMTALVSRYADSPALGMWEPMSEAEASTCSAAFEPNNCEGHQACPDETAAASALEYFFTTVGAQIHRLDAGHLVEGGFIGSGQCGTVWNDYKNLGASPGIDVLSVHDYYGAVPLGGDQWNGMAERFAQAKALDKPIITGEAGLEAGNGQSGCVSLQQRAQDISAKMTAQFGEGDSAFLVWDWLTDPLGPCSYNTGPSDSALLSAVASAPS